MVSADLPKPLLIPPPLGLFSFFLLLEKAVNHLIINVIVVSRIKITKKHFLLLQMGISLQIML